MNFVDFDSAALPSGSQAVFREMPYSRKVQGCREPKHSSMCTRNTTSKNTNIPCSRTRKSQGVANAISVEEPWFYDQRIWEDEDPNDLSSVSPSPQPGLMM